MSASLAVGMSKRKHRASDSSNNMKSLDSKLKHHKSTFHDLLAPIEPFNHLADTKKIYFERLRKKIDTYGSIFKPAHEFHKPGLFLYKRPVRSTSPQHAALLAQAGSIFHHVVVYHKHVNGALTCLEFGPSNGMDITQNFLIEVAAGPVFVSNPELPEPHRPMLYLDIDSHHHLNADHVKQALAFAQSKPYHALKNNCIAFADFIVRILTDGKVRNAPLIFDALVGEVPDLDSPLLPMLMLMAQLTWFDITDGSRLLMEYLNLKEDGMTFKPEVSSKDTTCGSGEENYTELRGIGNTGSGSEEEDAGTAMESFARACDDHHPNVLKRTFSGISTRTEWAASNSGDGAKRKGPRLPPRQKKASN